MQEEKSKKDSASGSARIVEWAKDVRSEFKKIIWPNRNDLAKKTITVIVTSLIFGLLIFVMDGIYGFGMSFFVNLF